MPISRMRVPLSQLPTKYCGMEPRTSPSSSNPDRDTQPASFTAQAAHRRARTRARISAACVRCQKRKIRARIPASDVAISHSTDQHVVFSAMVFCQHAQAAKRPAFDVWMAAPLVKYLESKMRRSTRALASALG